MVQYLQLLGSLLINFCICRRTDKAWCLLFPYNTKKRTPGCKTAPSTAWMLNSDVERYKLYNHTCLKWFTMQQKSASLELWPKPLLDEPQSCREQPEIRWQIIATLYCTHIIDLFQINFHSCIFSALKQWYQSEVVNSDLHYILSHYSVYSSCNMWLSACTYYMYMYMCIIVHVCARYKCKY